MSDADFVIPFDRLPENFAQSIEKPPANPVEPRAAATIVLVRDASDGMEVLLMRRSRNAGFVPGAYVFPGGRVDDADAGPEAVALFDELSAEAAADRLGTSNAGPPAIAFYLAALREAFEETGILVAFRPDGSAPPTAAEAPEVDALRNDVMSDAISFDDAVRKLDCRIAGAAVEYIAHWITPEAESRRYDTRFFAAKVPAGATAIVDPREMTAALWVHPAEALRRCDRGELPMVFPTIRTLEQLARYDTADEALDGFGAAPVPTILPKLVITPTGVGLEIEDDEEG